MKAKRAAPQTIDDYIARFPNHVQKILQKVRATINKAAPGAKETISYRIPAFALNGILVYFAAFKKHVGLYPRTTAIRKFRKELSGYETSTGSVRFPFADPMPLGLITKIVKFRVKENRSRAKPGKKRPAR